ncbi:HD domain-containing phosphohydrolase [Simiduia agarivorans]|uniref:Metal dependent phosphohydrolase n=1 Tax=Simiduia agarivorans (strain DSM 21679 / JCM 13881 / BCRC 17597 / SA1) TaxID=1117647 RepID=K4KPH8_SIMAS|nr:HD domain-containing phosphohydrolase [Simiduia agarivorans]AFV00942.1 metal dependent phosphohydrolase [Simiduia agarivorans SA1 = DSM 21679]
MAVTDFKDAYSNPDAETITDFFADFEDAYQASESLLLKLEHAPEDDALLNDLFRRVHTIKGNLIYIGLADITPLLQSVEDILEPLRKGQIRYNDLLSDLILAAMDHTHQWVQSRLAGNPDLIMPDTMQQLCADISAIALASESDRPGLIGKVLPLLDPKANSEPRTQLQQFKIDTHADLNFMESLLAAVDQRSPYWHGRTRRIALLALAMNKHAGQPVDPTQLLAAVYMHDFAMAFLPLSLLHKPERYTAHERQQLEEHTRAGSALLNSLGHWSDAARMVLEHHERANGEGYPMGLTDEHTCEGAKILAIVDTFDACINSRAHVNLPQRPLIRAILEINRHAGSLFNQHWVDTFNDVVRPRQKPPAPNTHS